MRTPRALVVEALDQLFVEEHDLLEEGSERAPFRRSMPVTSRTHCANDQICSWDAGALIVSTTGWAWIRRRCLGSSRCSQTSRWHAGGRRPA
jgi:hypothetical protein